MQYCITGCSWTQVCNGCQFYLCQNFNRLGFQNRKYFLDTTRGLKQFLSEKFLSWSNAALTFCCTLPISWMEKKPHSLMFFPSTKTGV